MFGTYLARELFHRRKQTIIVAIGLAIAIALVIVVNSVSAGVRDAQATALQSVYGVGTAVTITQPPAVPVAGTTQRGPGFDFGAGAGNTADGSTTIRQSRLVTGRGSTAFDATALATAQAVSGVAQATATLALNNVSFSGTLPTGGQRQAPNAGAPTTGGSDGAGGSSFSVDTFSVEGVDVAGAAVGPLTATTLIDGRTLAASDLGKNVVVIDKSYATSATLAVGGTLAIAGTNFTVIGIVGSTSSDAATASNTYIPLDVAQSLSTLPGKVTSIYVKATSASSVGDLKTALEKALPNSTVSTQADLASTVSGSLSTASDLVSNLGTWLSVIVLAAAFLLAILFTISGVGRRTREFGTLKAIGWSNGRIVRQVAGESLVHGIIGGIIGIAVGLIGVVIVNVVAPTLTASAAAAKRTGLGGAGGGPGDGSAPGFGQRTAQAASTTNITLHAPLTLSIILIAVGLAILGGLLAGAIGGWRAARLRPAEALRSVA